MASGMCTAMIWLLCCDSGKWLYPTPQASDLCMKAFKFQLRSLKLVAETDGVVTSITLSASGASSSKQVVSFADASTMHTLVGRRCKKRFQIKDLSVSQVYPWAAAASVIRAVSACGRQALPHWKAVASVAVGMQLSVWSTVPSMCHTVSAGGDRIKSHTSVANSGPRDTST